ncbi:helix-turn-helix transcriptional regulator [Phenylobacterium sp. LjRoot219]|uniref:helix-turn-helix domain-containing protein n=1 Tax=Phenylobacterium sp. LjRoot219 TaxID=3342283 RepID=UPI003ECF1F67
MNAPVRTVPAPADAYGHHDLSSPHPVDRQVGLRIRMRRKELRISQEKLAEALGLTFQQIQKYERAANRVSASKLFEIARALNTNVGYFYDGLGDADADAEAGPTPALTYVGHEFLLTSEGPELALLFQKLPRRRLRRKIVELVRAIADAEPELEGDAVGVEDRALEEG